MCSERQTERLVRLTGAMHMISTRAARGRGQRAGAADTRVVSRLPRGPVWKISNPDDMLSPLKTSALQLGDENPAQYRVRSAYYVPGSV